MELTTEPQKYSLPIIEIPARGDESSATLVIAHNDADGIVSAALSQYTLSPDAMAIVILTPAGEKNVINALRYGLDYIKDQICCYVNEILILDLGIDYIKLSDEDRQTLFEITELCDVLVIDHHDIKMKVPFFDYWALEEYNPKEYSAARLILSYIRDIISDVGTVVDGAWESAWEEEFWEIHNSTPLELKVRAISDADTFSYPSGLWFKNARMVSVAINELIRQDPVKAFKDVSEWLRGFYGLTTFPRDSPLWDKVDEVRGIFNKAYDDAVLTIRETNFEGVLKIKCLASMVSDVAHAILVNGICPPDTKGLLVQLVDKDGNFCLDHNGYYCISARGKDGVDMRPVLEKVCDVSSGGHPQACGGRATEPLGPSLKELFSN